VDKAELLKALCPSHRTTHRTPHHPITHPSGKHPPLNKANSSHNYDKLRQLKQWNNGLLEATSGHKGGTSSNGRKNNKGS